MSNKDVKNEFIKSSFEYLVKCGLENTSVRDLCRVTKISSGSMYYWFQGKDDIYISAAKYGISCVVEALFEYVFDNVHDIDKFFNNFLAEIDKYKAELRLVFQITTSPVYGVRMREKAEDFKPIYEKYINKICTEVGGSAEEIAPIIYMLISVVVDYITWEDAWASKMQLEYLRKSMAAIVNKE